MSDTPESPSEQLARLFHETYERLAPTFGYETREASAVPWDQVPEQNRALMTATVAELTKDRGIHVETYRAGDVVDGLYLNDQPYRWRVRHGNGEVMGSGEGYAEARDRDHAVSVLFPGVPTKEVEG